MKKSCKMLLLIVLPCFFIIGLTVWMTAGTNKSVPAMTPAAPVSPAGRGGKMFLLPDLPRGEAGAPVSPAGETVSLEIYNVVSGPKSEYDNRLDLVDIGAANSDIIIDLPYATSNNFTGKAVYDFNRALLRRPAYEKLQKASEALKKQGYRIKVWDALRPLWAQEVLWEAWPDANYIADPQKGSNHNRGVAVDVTLCDLDGNELLMPTGFDDFTPLAARDYEDVPAEAAQNARILEKAMAEAGFKPYAKEWWHYHDPIVETMEVPLYSGRDIARYEKISVTVNAAGDCVIGDDDRYSPDYSFSGLIQKGKTLESFSAGVKGLFPASDVNLVNLESVLCAPLPQTPKPAQDNGEYWFRGDPGYVGILTAGGVNAVSTANNHILDFGEEGFRQTVENLEKSGIGVSGYGNYAILEKGGARVGLLSYSLLGPLEEGEDITEIKRAVMADIDEIRGYTHVRVVSFHWGVEYGEVQSIQEEMARFAVNCGADAVVGHHPHILQKQDSYNGKPIFYSLGNFIYGGSVKPRAQAVDSCVASMKFSLDPLYNIESIDVQVTPVLTSTGESGYNSYSPVVAFGADAERILKTLDG